MGNPNRTTFEPTDPGFVTATAEPDIDPEILTTVFSDSPSSSQNELAAHVTPAEAPLVRAALLAAEEARQQGMDPGDALMGGVLRVLEAQRRQRSLQHALAEIDDLPSAA